MVNSKFKFYKDENDTTRMVIFMAQIVKEGLTYAVYDHDNYVEIELTGGY